MPTEVISTLVSVVGVGISLIAIITAYRKAPAEIAGFRAEANSDNANATKSVTEAVTGLSTAYTSTFNLLAERDAEYVRLNRRVLELEARDEEREKELEEERQRRVAAEARNEQLQKEVNDLKALVTALTEQVNYLKSQLPPQTTAKETATP